MGTREAMPEILCVDGVELTVRPVAITDVERLARMFERLSPEGVYYRFFSPLPRVPRTALQRMAYVDRRRRDALVVVHGEEIVAIASYDQLPEPGPSATRDAEIAVTVEDAWQHKGIGRQIAREVVTLAFGRGFDTIVAIVMSENRRALLLIRNVMPNAEITLTAGEFEARLARTA